MVPALCVAQDTIFVRGRALKRRVRLWYRRHYTNRSSTALPPPKERGVRQLTDLLPPSCVSDDTSPYDLARFTSTPLARGGEVPWSRGGRSRGLGRRELMCGTTMLALSELKCHTNAEVPDDK